VPDIAKYLLLLMRDSALRQRMGEAGRKRVVDLLYPSEQPHSSAGY
jgi:hypothetical protein